MLELTVCGTLRTFTLVVATDVPGPRRILVQLAAKVGFEPSVLAREKRSMRRNGREPTIRCSREPVLRYICATLVRRIEWVP